MFKLIELLFGVFLGLIGILYIIRTIILSYISIREKLLVAKLKREKIIEDHEDRE